MSKNIDEQYRKAFPKAKHSFQQSDWGGFEKAYLGSRRRPFLWALPLGLALIFSSFLNGDHQDYSPNYQGRTSAASTVEIPSTSPDVLAEKAEPAAEKYTSSKSIHQSNEVHSEPLIQIAQEPNSDQIESSAFTAEKIESREASPRQEKTLNSLPIEMQSKAPTQLAVQNERMELTSETGTSRSSQLLDDESANKSTSIGDFPINSIGFINSLEPISVSESGLLEPILPEFKKKNFHWGFAFYSSGFLAFGSMEISETMTSKSFLSREFGLLAMVDKNAWSAELGIGQRSVHSSAWLSEKVSWIETSINIVSNRSIQGIDSIPISHTVGLVQQGSNSYFGITSTDLSYDTTYAIVQDTLITQQELDSTRQGRLDFQISYIEFPFMLNHDFKTGPIRLQINAGLVANLLTSQKIESQSLALEQSYKAEVAKSYLQGMAGLSVVADLNTNWTVRLSGLMRRDLSASTSETAGDDPLRKMNYGLRLSLRYSPY